MHRCHCYAEPLANLRARQTFILVELQHFQPERKPFRSNLSSLSALLQIARQRRTQEFQRRWLPSSSPTVMKAPTIAIHDRCDLAIGHTSKVGKAKYADPRTTRKSLRCICSIGTPATVDVGSSALSNCPRQFRVRLETISRASSTKIRTSILELRVPSLISKMAMVRPLDHEHILNIPPPKRSYQFCNIFAREPVNLCQPATSTPSFQLISMRRPAARAGKALQPAYCNGRSGRSPCSRKLATPIPARPCILDQFGKRFDLTKMQGCCENTADKKNNRKPASQEPPGRVCGAGVLHRRPIAAHVVRRRAERFMASQSAR